MSRRRRGPGRTPPCDRTPAPAPDEPGAGAVWVESGVAPDGTYVVELHAGGDWSTILDRDRAIAYAAAVHDIAARAEYDAAVYRQLTAKGVHPAQVTAFVVDDLRPERPPAEYAIAVTAPLAFTPGVSADNGPFVLVHLHLPGPPTGTPDALISQWTPAEARTHAGHVLDTLAVVDLDAGYRRLLVGVMGLDDPTARAVIGNLGEHRHPSPERRP